MKLESFNIGDIVKVTHQPTKKEFKKYKVTYYWGELQESLIGKVFKVREFYPSNSVYKGFVRLYTISNVYVGIGVPFFSLKKIKNSKLYYPKWKSVWK